MVHHRNKAFPVPVNNLDQDGTTGSGTTPKPAWNQGGRDSPGKLRILLTVGILEEYRMRMYRSPTSDGSWNGGPKTGFGCSGNYQHGHRLCSRFKRCWSCKTISSAILWQQPHKCSEGKFLFIPRVPTAVYNPQGSPAGCSQQSL